MASGRIDCVGAGFSATYYRPVDTPRIQFAGGDLRTRGLLLTFLGIVVISPETLLIRLISVDYWTILFWRGLLAAAGLALIVTLSGDTKKVWRRFTDARPWWILIVLFYAVSHLLFVVAVTHTTAANALVILSVAPLSAVVMSRVFLEESVPPRTWIAVSVVTLAVILIFRGSIGGGTLFGDLAALLATLGLSGNLTALRRVGDINMIPALAIGALLTGVLSFPFAQPPTVEVPDIALLVLVGLLLVPVAIALITLAPRYVSAAEVALVLPLDALLGSLWVWLVLGEAPSLATVAAGAVILTTLIVHSAVAIRALPPANE